MSSDTNIQTKFCSSCGDEISAEADVCPNCGVSQTSGQSQQGKEPSGRLISALIGGLFSLFLGWIPFLGPIMGGGISGYLRGSNRKESVLVGTLANVLASIPFILFAAFGTVAQVVEGTVNTFVGWVILMIVVLIYFYGCGAVGGLIGSEFTSRGEPN